MIIKNGYLKPSDTKISSIPFDELRIARISIDSPDGDFKQNYIMYVIDYIKGDFFYLKKIDKILKDGLFLTIISNDEKIATVASPRGVIMHNKLSDIDGWVQFPITARIILHKNYVHSDKKMFLDTSSGLNFSNSSEMHGVEEMISFLCCGVCYNDKIVFKPSDVEDIKPKASDYRYVSVYDIEMHRTDF